MVFAWKLYKLIMVTINKMTRGVQIEKMSHEQTYHRIDTGMPRIFLNAFRCF